MAIEQRLQNIHFQFTDAIYEAVITNVGIRIPRLEGRDIQERLLGITSHTYQVYLSICMFSRLTLMLPWLTRALFSCFYRAPRAH
jgi:hypothetical protein